jgi:diacylglycerol kinase
VNYEAPKLELLGSAVEAVCGSMRKTSNHADSAGDLASAPAYEADE